MKSPYSSDMPRAKIKAITSNTHRAAEAANSIARDIVKYCTADNAMTYSIMANTLADCAEAAAVEAYNAAFSVDLSFTSVYKSLRPTQDAALSAFEAANDAAKTARCAAAQALIDVGAAPRQVKVATEYGAHDATGTVIMECKNGFVVDWEYGYGKLREVLAYKPHTEKQEFLSASVFGERIEWVTNQTEAADQ